MTDHTPHANHPSTIFASRRERQLWRSGACGWCPDPKCEYEQAMARATAEDAIHDMYAAARWLRNHYLLSVRDDHTITAVQMLCQKWEDHGPPTGRIDNGENARAARQVAADQEAADDENAAAADHGYARADAEWSEGTTE